MSWAFLKDLSRAVSRVSRYPVPRNHLRSFSDPTGPNTITITDRIGKQSFPAPEHLPGEAENSSTINRSDTWYLVGLGEKPNSFRGEK